jgi:malonate decarboxylase beta subunit
MSSLLQPHEADWYEASARERVAGLLDPKSFVEFLGPEQRAMSPTSLSSISRAPSTMVSS